MADWRDDPRYWLPGDAEGFNPLMPRQTAQSQGMTPEQYDAATRGNGVGLFGKVLYAPETSKGQALYNSLSGLLDPIGAAGHFVQGLGTSADELDHLLQHPSHDPAWGHAVAGPAFDLTSAVAMGGGVVPAKAAENSLARDLFSNSKEAGAPGVVVNGAKDQQPIRAYHGTGASPFDKFNTNSGIFDNIGIHFGTPEQADYVARFKSYDYNDSSAGEYGRGTAHIIPADIHANNIVDVPDLGAWSPIDVAAALEKESGASGLRNEIAAVPENERTAALRDWLLANNIDALRYNNKHEGAGASYIAIRPGTVKSPLTGETLFSNRSEAPGIIAYHGSPHDFDKFDMSKIGSGEGAQAYGHGLYFADQEATAQSYKGAGVPASQSQAVTEDFNAAVKHYGGDLGKVRQHFEDIQKNGAPLDQLIARSALKDFEGLSRLGENGGRMYQVRINADPESFLDWDKPLSEQSEKVMNAVNAAGVAQQRPSAWYGETAKLPSGTTNVWRNNGRTVVERPDGKFIWTDGYGDGKPMGGPFQTLDEAKTAALANFSMPHKLGSEVATELKHKLVGYGPHGDPSVSKALREAGIPGIKYLDQGSRAAGEGSRNYVVFDDKLVEILKKYGLMGYLGGGAAASGLFGGADEH